jgi:hypothetical protein
MKKIKVGITFYFFFHPSAAGFVDMCGAATVHFAIVDEMSRFLDSLKYNLIEASSLCPLQSRLHQGYLCVLPVNAMIGPAALEMVTIIFDKVFFPIGWLQKLSDRLVS